MDNSSVLKIGSSINIQRTSGRVHSAYVAGINYDQKSATVEWFEQGETKGKEIEMDIIKSLNPDIIIQFPGEEREYHDEERDYVESPKMNKLQKNPTKHSLAANTVVAKTANGSTRRRTENGHFTQPTIAEIATSKINSNIPNIRRSNVVKEVEKLKKNREERRQRHAEEKAEKDAFLQMAPGNPHWELLNMILDYRRRLDINPLTENDTVEDHLITVCVRKRPLNKREDTRKEVDVITVPSKNQLIVHEPKNKVDLTKYLDNQLFRFDYAFDETCTNEIVYKYTAQPLVKTIFEGGFSTCFAYGQTGSGKTHTMGGNFNGKNQDCHKGIYAMAAADVFKLVNSEKYRHLSLVVSSSFFEIYSGKVFDLLNSKAKLRILEDGKQQVQVVGLTEKVVSSVDQVLKLITSGNQARTSGQTSANANSSRSHAIFQIILRKNDNLRKVYGKFSLIDLAGNERGADTSSADRQTRMEGAEINKSLLALKECIRALGRRGAHLPFRVSKLTQVLRDSFVGPNSRTCMIAMISPGISSCEHSLNTLRYADRVKELGGGDLQTNQADEPFENDKNNDDGDISQLISFSENDLTADMLNFHQAISQLQAAEDNMLESHKQLIDQMKSFIKQGEQLLRIADTVDYDQEAYCMNFKHIMKSINVNINQSEVAMTEFLKKMADEEQLSRKTKRK